MTEPVSAPQQYPRGWYPDPATPGRDRWWDGQQSTRFTARTVDPSKALFGVPYVHSMRIGANRILIATRVLVLVAFLLLMFLFIATGAVIVGGASIVEFAAVTAVGVAACLVTVVLGIMGLRRSPALGAKGVAIWAIASGGTFGLFMLLPLLIAFAATR